MNRKDIHNIANILASDPHLVMNWLHFFHALELPSRSHDILQLNNGFKNGTVTTYELLHRTLEIWISMTPRASGDVLISVLVQAGYYYAADNLTEYYASKRDRKTSERQERKLSHAPKSIDEDPFVHGVQSLVVNFTGRENELKILFEALSEGSNTNIFKITGMGGLGKTTLARKFAHEVIKGGLMNCVWLDCDGIKTLTESVKTFGSAVQLDSSSQSLGAIINQATRKLSRKTVLLMDNIDDVNEEITAILEQLDRDKVLVVVTSRDISVLMFGGTHLRLKTLLDHEAIRLVQSGLKSENTGDIEKLCISMQNYPLALQQAIATIIQEQHFNSNYNINEYLGDLQNNEKKEYLFNQDLINLFHHQYTKTTLSTWDVTLDKLSKQDDKGRIASKILQLLAWCKPENVQIDKLINPMILTYLAAEEETTQPITKTSIDRAIRLLQTYSFIDFDTKRQTISIHRLVQEVIKLKFKLQQSGVFSVLLQAYDTCYDMLTSSFGAEVVTAAMTDDNIIKSNSEVVVRMLRLRRIPLKTKEDMVKRLLSLLSKQDPNFHHTVEAEVAVAESLMNKKGKQEDGMQWWKTIIFKLDDTLDTFHPTTLNTLRLYAGQLSRLKRYEEEAGIWEVVVHRGTQVWRENDHWTLMKCVFSLGNAWQKAGNFDKSLTYLTEFYKYSSTASSIEPRSSEYDAENLISGILRSRGKTEAEIEEYLDSV